MSEDKITMEELRFLAMFQDFTGATAFRCIRADDEGKLYFLVSPSDIGKAIGKKGSNVKLLSKLFQKKVEIVPYSPDMTLEEAVKALFPGVRILGVKVKEQGDNKILLVRVAEEDKGKAIGREGRNIARARRILRALYGFTKVVIV
ncbi:MAG: NusA-like transcription termination signal-binding factor [Desulfurococcales archaeon]|nr:NusA-like transcription termination signal-binding factor [Desulfurococcales archaeon]